MKRYLRPLRERGPPCPICGWVMVWAPRDRFEREGEGWGCIVVHEIEPAKEEVA